MDYKQKYENALNRAKSYKGLIAEMGIVFPELKESEDERMRKNMREFLLDAPSQDIVNHHLDLEETLAWLEKQGEQKVINEYNEHEPTSYEIEKWNEAYEKGYDIGYMNGKNEQKLTDAIAKMKPVEWSEEDERVIIAIKEAVSYYWSDDSQAKTDILAWIEQQKEQKSAKWSNEDKEVDLDKSLTSFMSRYAYENDNKYPSAIDIAKHFFELGLKVNNDAVIEKACEWLKNNVTYTHPRTGETKCVVNLNAFIDAMKG